MQEASPPNRLPYYFKWMENTFTSHKTIETLLAPERDAGNLSQHDYSLAMRFLPWQHYLQYQYPLAWVGSSTAYMVRRPHWSSYRTVSFTVLAGVVGYNIGLFIKMNNHARFVQAMDNPAGFAHALDNVQTRFGFKMDGPRLYIIHSGPTLDDSDKDHQVLPASEMLSNSSEPVPDSPSTPETAKHQSTWDQIRAANSHTARSSSWDVLRQSHERARVQQRGDIADIIPDTNVTGDASDRAIEQARFDALLEKERNFRE